MHGKIRVADGRKGKESLPHLICKKREPGRKFLVTLYDTAIPAENLGENIRFMAKENNSRLGVCNGVMLASAAASS
jgi:hypothetical protein